MQRAGSEWETGQTTQAETRYGCFLPDLTGLARSLSAADLPPHYIRCRRRRGKFWGLIRQAEAAQRFADRLPDLGAAGMRLDEAADREARLQFRHPPRQGLGLVAAAEH